MEDSEKPSEDEGVGIKAGVAASESKEEAAAPEDSAEENLFVTVDDEGLTECSGEPKRDDREFEGVEMELVPEEEVLSVDHEGTPVQDEPEDRGREPMDLATPLDEGSEAHLPEPHEEEKPWCDVEGEEGPADMALDPCFEEEEEEEEGGFKLELTAHERAKTDEDELGSSFSSNPKFEEQDELQVEEEVDEEAADAMRLNSHIDPSYQPESEELLYEGDVDIEPVPPQENVEAEWNEEAMGDREEENKEEGYVVRIHDDNMDIDEGATKSQEPVKEPPPKKSSTPPSRVAPPKQSKASSDSRFVSPSVCVFACLSTGTPTPAARPHTPNPVVLIDSVPLVDNLTHLCAQLAMWCSGWRVLWFVNEVVQEHKT